MTMDSRLCHHLNFTPRRTGCAKNIVLLRNSNTAKTIRVATRSTIPNSTINITSKAHGKRNHGKVIPSMIINRTQNHVSNNSLNSSHKLAIISMMIGIATMDRRALHL